MTIRRGFSYPLQVDNGGLKLSEDADLVAEAIYSVLETRIGERVWRPRSYGTPDYCFSAVSNAAFIPARMEVALQEQVTDPDEFQVIGAFNETEGTVFVDLRYTLNKIEQPPIQFVLRNS